MVESGDVARVLQGKQQKDAGVVGRASVLVLTAWVRPRGDEVNVETVVLCHSRDAIDVAFQGRTGKSAGDTKSIRQSGRGSWPKCCWRRGRNL